MNVTKDHRVTFTQGEIRVFRSYPAIPVMIAAAMFFAAPKGIGQVIGILFALALIPVPPLVIYFIRRRRHANEPNQHRN
jgi:hypothetical protein